MKSIEEQIGEKLANETGMRGIGVSICRRGINSKCVKCSVAEFLMRHENQSGMWLIDGGWGGPPGPIVVRWNDEANEWENGGFCGRKFTT